QRAVGALKWSGNDRVLVGDGAAKFVAQILLHLGERVGDAVLMVLGGDPRERIGLVAIALKIALSDLPEDTGKAAFDRVLLLAIARPQKDVADPCARDF